MICALEFLGASPERRNYLVKITTLKSVLHFIAFESIHQKGVLTKIWLRFSVYCGNVHAMGAAAPVMEPCAA